MALTYEVNTDLDPMALTELAIVTFQKWVSFALGKESIGGNRLMHPTGRYAASMSYKQTGVSTVAIIADEKLAPEGGWIESGRAGFSLKDKMLQGKNVRRSKAGYLYRWIPINKGTDSLAHAFRVKAHSPVSKQIWASIREKAGKGNVEFALMSNKPGSASWIIPPMPAYSPAKILADAIREQYGAGR